MQSLVCLAIGCAVLGPPMGLPPFPPAPPGDGQEPAAQDEPPTVDEPRPTLEQLAQGEPYRVAIGERTHITFRTEAPMGSFEGSSGEVMGFVIVEPLCLRSDWSPSEDDQGTPRGVLLAGAFAVPVTSIETGIPQRDAHLASPEWLDAQAEPAIIFELAAFEQPRKIRQEAGVTTFQGTLVGDFVIHGKRAPIRIEEATVALMPESETSVRFGPGDLLMIRCNYSLKLQDFGVDHPLIGRSVGKTVQIDQAILMTTAPDASAPVAEPDALEAPPMTGERVDPGDITPQE